MDDWSSPGFARLAELIRRRAGLTFGAARRADVEASLRRAMDRRGVIAPDRFIVLLDEDTALREAVVAELTIGETYFGRIPEHFELLRWKLLPELLSGRPPEEAVRVWSAGCASGEEPYSVAMVFDELNVLGRAYIVGTDLTRTRLDRARLGLYTRWSLRGVPEATVDAYFKRRGDRYELVPRIRDAVRFDYLNLAEDPYPSLSSGIWGMDVILCRNVLMYFDPPTIARVARRLVASLSEDGWLLLGPADPAIADYVDCDVVMTDGGLAYRRPGRAGTRDVRTRSSVAAGPPEPALETEVEPSSPLATPEAVEPPSVLEVSDEPEERPPDPAQELDSAWARRDFDRVRALASAAALAGEADARVWACWLRALANQGHLVEASEVAERAIAALGPNAELLYLDAVILLHGGHAAEAVTRARQALYLDRSLAVAHITLADAQQRLGRIAEARRALEAAAVQLERLPATEPVRAADGEPAGRLARLVRLRLRFLEEAA